MRQSKLQLDSPSGVAYGGRAKFNVTAGAIIDYVVIKGTNIDNDQIGLITLNLSGDNIVSVDGQRLRSLDAYKKMHQQNSTWVIPFADLLAKSQQGNELSGLVTTEKDNINITLDIGAKKSPAQDNLDPALSGYLVQRGRALTPAGTLETRQVLPRLYEDHIGAGATGENNYKNFEKNRLLRRMHMFASTVTRLKIKRNKVELFDLSKDDNNFELKRMGLDPQTNVYHFDPIATHFALVDMLNTGEEFEIRPTVSTAGDVLTVFETLERV